MSRKLQMQLVLPYNEETTFHALSDAEMLKKWFAESVEVSPSHYNFWGRFTPENPTQTEGIHPILAWQNPQEIKYQWNLKEKESQVQILLRPKGEQTGLIVLHDGAGTEESDYGLYEFEDFWFLALENLRRFLAGRDDMVWCDFSASMLGDVQHSIEINAAADVVYDTLIRPEQLERWIASQAKVEAQIGGNYDIGWGQFGSIKILDLQSNQKLVTEWTDDTTGKPPTVVTWELAESGGKTRLTLVHSGFAADDNNAGLYAGWLNYMGRIKSIAEEGDSWQAPVLKVPEEMQWIYAASINQRQSELIPV